MVGAGMTFSRVQADANGTPLFREADTDDGVVSPCPRRRTFQSSSRLSPQLDVLPILHQVPAFAALDAEQLLDLTAHVRFLEVARGRLVTLQGHRVDSLYIVASGCFRRFRTSSSGREQILALLTPGDTFGEVPVLDGGEDFASTQAIQRGAVFTVPAAQVRDLLSNISDPRSGVQGTLTARVRQMVGIIDDLSFCRVVERIARLILEHPHSPDRPHLTQTTMAAMAGTTREVVARTIHELNEGGAIAVDHGRISVRDAALLRQIASGRHR
jgi:CRP/FNR family transcriptional regulator, cyclic AMP receptor protein